MSLIDAIADLASGTYTVTRHATGGWTMGRYSVNGSPTTFDIVGSLQPAPGRTLRNLQDGQRADDLQTMFTNTELRTRTPSNDPDQVAIGGEVFEVTQVQRWDAFGETHYECTLSRVSLP